MRNDVAAKEAQIRDLTEQIEHNETTLDRLLKSIAVDTDAIKRLEEQLERGEVNSVAAWWRFVRVVRVSSILIWVTNRRYKAT